MNETNYKTYLIKETTTGNYKIGTSRNPIRRFKALQTGNINIEMIGITTESEKALHKQFDKFRLTGEWFDFSSSPSQEAELRSIFTPYEEIFGIIKKLEITPELIKKINELEEIGDPNKIMSFSDKIYNVFGIKEYTKLCQYGPFLNMIDKAYLRTM